MEKSEALRSIVKIESSIKRFQDPSFFDGFGDTPRDWASIEALEDLAITLHAYLTEHPDPDLLGRSRKISIDKLQMMTRVMPERIEPRIKNCITILREITKMETKEVNKLFSITVADKMLRELQLIEFLFKLQLSDQHDDNPWLTVINGNRERISGERISGRYMGSSFMIYSRVELFNIQNFKQIFTDRFESTQNPTLILNQSKQIRDKASGILRFITENRIEENYKVKKYIEWNHKQLGYQNEWSKLKSEGRENDFDWDKTRSEEHKHSADIFILDNLSVQGVAYDRFMEPGAFTGSPDMYKFQYLTSNALMEKVCRDVVSFLDSLLSASPDNSEGANPVGESIMDYSGIAQALKKHINDASDLDLKTIIDSKALPTGVTQKEWIGTKANAHRFCQKFLLPLAQFNKCFKFTDGKPLKAGHKKGIEIELAGSIWDIIKKYPNKNPTISKSISP